MRKIVNVGIAGFGTSGSIFQAPFLDADNRFLIKKVYERTTSNSVKRYPYVELVRNFEALLTPDIDIVIVSTPNLLHFDMAQKALKAGKNTIIEKPMATTAAQVDELIALARNQKLLLSAYQNRRWDGGFLTVQKLIRAGLLGDILDYEVHFDRYDPGLNRKEWKEQDAKGVGILYDLGTHLVDQAVALFGAPEEVYGDLRIQREQAVTDDNFQVYLYYPDKKAVLSAGQFIRERGPHIAVHGKKGSYVKYGMDIQEDRLSCGHVPSGPDWGREAEAHWGILNTEFSELHFCGTIETEAGNYGGYYDNIYKALNGEAELAVKPEQTRDVIRILELAVESSLLKKRISF